MDGENGYVLITPAWLIAEPVLHFNTVLWHISQITSPELISCRKEIIRCVSFHAVISIHLAKNRYRTKTNCVALSQQSCKDVPRHGTVCSLTLLTTGESFVMQ